MAKRRKSSPLEDMLDLVAMLPWWAGVALGVAGYLLLHRLATPITVTGVQPGVEGPHATDVEVVHIHQTEQGRT